MTEYWDDSTPEDPRHLADRFGERTVPRMPSEKCRCSHLRDVHGLDRKQRPTCFGSTVCACRQFREPSP